MTTKKRPDLERLEAGPVYTVHLDAGSFNWLHEILQAKTKTQQSLEAYQRLVRRTLQSFDEALAAQDLEEAAAHFDPQPMTVRRRHVPRKP